MSRRCTEFPVYHGFFAFYGCKSIDDFHCDGFDNDIYSVFEFIVRDGLDFDKKTSTIVA